MQHLVQQSLISASYHCLKCSYLIITVEQTRMFAEVLGCVVGHQPERTATPQPCLFLLDRGSLNSALCSSLMDALLKEQTQNVCWDSGHSAFMTPQRAGQTTWELIPVI